MESTAFSLFYVAGELRFLAISMNGRRDISLYFERYAKLSPLPVIFLDQALKVVWLNDLAREVIRGGSDAMIGSDVADLLFEWMEEAETVGEALEWLEERMPQEIGCMGGDWSSVCLEPVEFPDGAKGSIIYALPADSEASESSRMNDLLSLLSREARSPLQTISGYSELLLANARDETDKRYIYRILAASRDLARLWVDAQEYLSIGSVRDLDTPNQSFAFLPLLHEAIEEAEEELANNQITLSFKVEPGMPPGFVGDRASLSFLLLRLICNFTRQAGKHTVMVAGSWARDSHIGKPCLRVTLSLDGETEESEADELEEFTIEPDQVSKFGLGLTVVVESVRRQGGKVFCRRIGVDWKRVVVDLPLAPVFEMISPEGGGSIVDGSRLAFPEIETLDSNPRVLVVDDNHVSADITRNLIARLGYEVEATTSGAKAIAMFEERPFDAAFLDVQMPEMDGFDLCKRLKSLSQGVHVVALTASALHGDKELCLNRGMDDYLSKPVTISRLRNALRIASVAGKGMFDIPLDEKQETLDLKRIPVFHFDDWAEERAMHRKILGMLLEEAPGVLAKIGRAWESWDAAEAEKWVHYFKGSLDVVGAPRMTELCLFLLKGLRAGELEAVDSRIGELPKVYEEFRAAMLESGYLQEE